MPNTISHGSHDYPDYSKSILLLKVNHHHNVISQNFIVICSSSMQFFNSKLKADSSSDIPGVFWPRIAFKTYSEVIDISREEHGHEKQRDYKWK